jgi:hypothetical protein
MNFKDNYQKLLLTSLTVVLVLGLGTSQAFAAPTGSGADIDVGTQVVAPQAEPLDCTTDSGDIVAMETSRGQSFSPHSTLETDLEANGFVVKEFDIDTDGIPSCIVKMIIPSTDVSDFCIIGNDYTPTQVTDIANWVGAGGALLLLNEWGTGPNCGDLTDEVATALGETTGSVLANRVYTAGVNYNAANPATLFSGVATWDDAAGNIYAASANSIVTDGIFPAGNPTVIAKNVGDGCVLMTSDGNWIRDGFIASNDNQQLALNAFVYLNECIEPDDIPVGGEFLSVDSAALLVAGAQANAVWILSALAVIGSVAFGALYITSKRG